MANPTTNFGWVMPTSTDLVTDLPADFEVFGQGVDTSLAQLKGGTTGQVLSKTSNTDMAFTWVAPTTGDITGVTAGTGISGGGTSGDVTITNSMATAIDAKGDLIAGTGADAFSRLAVGTDGQVLSASSAAATGLAWTTISASAFTQLATGTLSGASTTISSISASYKSLQLNIKNPTNASVFNLALQRNGSSTAGYYGIYASQSGSWTHQSAGTSNILVPNNQSSASGTNINVFFPNYSVSGYKSFQFFGQSIISAATSGIAAGYGTDTNSQTATSSITILASAGTFTGGEYTLWGIN